jgi:hypothetical protein
MRKIIVHEFITLDGVIQAPGSPTEDTDGGFTHGGWTHPYWHDEIGAHLVRYLRMLIRCCSDARPGKVMGQPLSPTRSKIRLVVCRSLWFPIL